MPSDICKLVSPDKVVFITKGDLPKSLIIEDKEKGAELAVEVNKNRDDTQMNYYWTRTYAENKSDAITHNKTEEYKDSLAITEPGYYHVRIEADLNREQKEASSEICRVTFAPELPTISYGPKARENTFESQDDLEIPVYTQKDGSQIVLDLALGSFIPEGYEEDYDDDSFFSDDVSYDWYVQIGEQPSRPVVETDSFYEYGLDTAELGIRKPEGDVVHMFRCLVTNTLNGATKSQTLGDPTVLIFKVL
jgi:hypothetical protein